MALPTRTKVAPSAPCSNTLLADSQPRSSTVTPEGSRLALLMRYLLVRSSRRKILPTLDLGSSSRNSMYLGRL